MIVIIETSWIAERADAVLEELLEVLDVARHPAHEHAGLLLGEEVEAEPLQVREDEDAQPVHDPGGEPTRRVDQAALGVGDDDGRSRSTASDARRRR